jgi:hypothetical protein
MCYKDLRSGRLYDYNVDLVSTPPNYGGLRWWFICPGVAERACRRRVRKLYLAPGREGFACRQCCDLCHISQREDAMTRALSTAQAIRVRLGGSAAMYRPFSPQARANAVEDLSPVAGEGKRILAGELERRIGIL